MTATTHKQTEIKTLPIMMSLVIGVFFAILNETLLNVAYSDLMQAFDIRQTTVQWLTTSFMLIVGILVPISALLVQWFTTRQMFLGAMTLFAIGTAIGAIAPNFGILLVGRIVQAAGTGLLLPVMMNTILLLYPPEKRGGAMGMIGLVIMFAPALGPTLSGLIVDALSWRWLFILVIPFALFSIVFAAIYLTNVSTVTRPKVDVLSVILSTLGFGGIVFGFSSLGESEAGFANPTVAGSIIVSLVSLVWFIIRQLRVKEPILEMRVFKYPMFSLTTILMIIMMMTMFSTMIMLPLLLQDGLLMRASIAGLALLPGGLLNGFASPIAGRIFDRYGPRVLIIPGAAALVVVMFLFTQVNLNTTFTTMVILHTILMISIAMVMMPGQTNGLNELPRSYYPHGTAVINTLMQVSGAIGIALFLGIMAAGQIRFAGGDPALLETPEALLAGAKIAFTIGLIFAVASFVLALFIKRASNTEETESGSASPDSEADGHTSIKAEPVR